MDKRKSLLKETPNLSHKHAIENLPLFPFLRHDLDEDLIRPRPEEEPNTPLPSQSSTSYTEITSSTHAFVGLSFAPTACESLMRHDSRLQEEHVTQAIRDEINRSATLHSRPRYIYLHKRIRKRRKREKER